MAATVPIEVRAGPAFGTLTASPKASLAKPFCNRALGIRRWIYGDDTEVVSPLVGPKSHSENHGRISQFCSSSRTTKRKTGCDRRNGNYETSVQPLQNHRRNTVPTACHS